MSKRCLIISQGPVPTPQQPKVEGGGLRCWGLAKGIAANGEDVDITVAYHESYKQPGEPASFEGINITTWNIDSIEKIVHAYDTVIVSYCMGSLSVKVSDVVRPDQQLVLDCYVPIYVEVSARNTDDIDREYNAFHTDVGHWAHVLKRGDLFLCSSDAQLRYYKGVLSALGRVNPITYGDELIRVVPYGIYREDPVATEKPISKLIGSKADDFKKILWFGGIYPWFDLKQLVDAIKEVNRKVPAKLVIVGAKNPFNDHPDFVRPYQELLDHINADKELKDQVILQDWVDFNKRADWYLDSDLVVVVNKLGEENELAWRTRLVDFLWADLPIITNGGDPLGQKLLDNNAAALMHGTSATEIAADMTDVLADKYELTEMKRRLKDLKQEFYWDVVTHQLAKDIVSQRRAKDLEQYGKYTIARNAKVGSAGKAKKALAKARMIPAYTRKYGARNTYHTLRTTLRNQYKKTPIGGRTKPKIVMIAHQLDLSGAPYVFLDLTKELVTKTSARQIEFHSFNPTEKDNIKLLNRLGIKPLIHVSKDIGIDFVKGDSIVLNTVAHSTVLKESVYRSLEQGVATKLSWFIHEDEPELIFDPKEANRLRSLLNSGKIVMFIAADRALKNYQVFFENTANIRLQPYKYVIDEQYRHVRDEADFDKLSFILPGTIGDGRKGQLPIFYALGEFVDNFYSQHPEQYRDFELVYVGVGDDFLSRQMLKHAPKLFGDRFKHYGRVSHDKSQKLIMQSNMTICYSLRECLPLFVFEGMAAGHPILRNDSSGMEEQLFVDKNGFYIESTGFKQVVDTFERVLNKSKVSAKTLAEMSKFSNGVALAQEKHSYQPMVGEIIEGLE